jgi:MerR family transcriptional regulator, aldehyde-responsive regulator
MRIKAVSQKYHVSQDTLRYYEKIGMLDPVQKHNGIRHYREQDLERIYFIQCMKPTGMTLDQIKTYFHLYEQGQASLEERIELLKNQKTIALMKLKDLQEAIAYIDHKIELNTKKLKGE